MLKNKKKINNQWVKIHPDFAEIDLVEAWTECGFDYDQVEKWKNIFGSNFDPYEYQFTSWLRDENFQSEICLSKDEIKQLKEKYNKILDDYEKEEGLKTNKQLLIQNWQEGIGQYSDPAKIARNLFPEDDGDSGVFSLEYSKSTASVLSPGLSTRTEWLSPPESSPINNNRSIRENKAKNRLLSKLEEEQLELSNKLEEEKRRLKKLQTELDKKNSEVNKAEKEIKSLTQQIEEQEKKNKEIAEKNQSLIDENAKLKGDLTEYFNETVGKTQVENVKKIAELESQLVIKEQKLKETLVSVKEEIKKAKQVSADELLLAEADIQKSVNELVDGWAEKQNGNEKIISELSNTVEMLKRRLRDRGLSTASNSTNSSVTDLNTLGNEVNWEGYELSPRSSSPTKSIRSNSVNGSSPLRENFSYGSFGRKRSSLSNTNEFQSRDLKKDLAFERAEHAKSYCLYLDEEKKVTDLTNECANLSTEIATKNTELTELDQTLAETHDILAAKNETISDCCTRIEQLESEVIWTEEISTKQEEVIKNQQESIAKLEEQKENLSNILVEANDKLDENDFKIFDLTSEIATKEAEIQNLTTAHTQLQTDLQAERNLVQQKNNEITATKNLLTTEQANHQTTAQSLQNERNAHNVEKTNSDKEIAGLKTKLGKKTAECQTLSQQNTDLQTQIDSVNSQKSDLETKLANQHTNCQQNCCLGDYERIKNELAGKEGAIVEKINSSLNLHLPENTNLDQVITIIKELIVKPPTIINNSQHHQEPVENPLEFLATVKTEDLEWLKEVLSQQLYTIAKQKLTNQDFTSYSQLAEVRNSLVNQQFSQSANKFQLVSQNNNSLAKQKNILWLLLAIGLLGVAIITGKLRKSRMLNKKIIQSKK